MTTGEEIVTRWATMFPERSPNDLRTLIGLIDGALAAAVNEPVTRSFIDGVMIEAPHQRQRWGDQHDAEKNTLDWYWTLGYLAQKAVWAELAGNTDKALHHTITAAALLANWHARLLAIQPAPSEEPGA